MALMRRLRWLALGLLLLVATLGLSACGSDTEAAPAITASVLIEPSAGDSRWFRDVEVSKGTDSYELLEAVTGGELEAQWFPAFRSHFVESVFGIGGEGFRFWLVFVWDENQSAWSPLPVGADLFSVKDGHVMGWALLEAGEGMASLPASAP